MAVVRVVHVALPVDIDAGLFVVKRALGVVGWVEEMLDDVRMGRMRVHPAAMWRQELGE